jgi:hypothetical protein
MKICRHGGKLAGPRLPQLKGKAKVIGADAHDQAAWSFADDIVRQLRLSNVVLMKGPRLPIAAATPTRP